MHIKLIHRCCTRSLRTLPHTSFRSGSDLKNAQNLTFGKVSNINLINFQNSNYTLFSKLNQNFITWTVMEVTHGWNTIRNFFARSKLTSNLFLFVAQIKKHK